MFPIIDTHCHLYYKDEEESKWDFSKDISEVIERANEAGVRYFLIPNIDRESLPLMQELIKQFPQQCFPMIGLHPTNVDETWREQLQQLKTELENNLDKYIAIGEIGLDYHWSTEYKEEMVEVFTQQLRWADLHCLPVSIHCRDAEDEVIDLLKPFQEKGLKGVLHSFSGTNDQLQRAINDLPHFMIGVNGIITFKNNPLAHHLPDLVPLNRIVVETDAPFLAPSPHRGKRNEPAFLTYIVGKLSDIYRINTDELREQLYTNSIQLYNLENRME